MTDQTLRRLIIGALFILTLIVWGIAAYLILGQGGFWQAPGPSPVATLTPAPQAEAALTVTPLGPDRFAVSGQNWPPNVPVELHLLAPEAPTYWLGTAQTSSAGVFSAEFQLGPGVPTGPGVVLRASAGGQTVQVPFPLEFPTASPSPTEVIETPTVTATPSPTASATATPTPEGGAAGPVCTVRLQEANVRAEPTVSGSVLTVLAHDAAVDPIARDASGLWIRVVTDDDLRGWISIDALTCSIDTQTLPVAGEAPTATPSPTATPTAEPTATPTPTVVVQHWRGEYYRNDNLTGEPVFVRDDTAISFDWGTGTPAPNVPADNFSVRWTRDWRFTEGTYRFALRIDDGARLFIDGDLVLDEWQVGPERTATVDVPLQTGDHEIRLEYFEAGGEATAFLWWSQVPDTITGWRGEYFDGTDPEGTPLVVRDESSIDFDWDLGSPAPVLGNDYFSARWTRDVSFDAGRYRFTVFADDGVRLWVDDELILDEWGAGRATYTVEHTIARGTHEVRVEYFEATGQAGVEVGWRQVDQTFEDWRGEYYDNPELAGDPVLVREDEAIDFDWGTGRPHASLPADEFSVRWTGRPEFEEGTYRFIANTDDGVRLFLDGSLILDKWSRGRARYTTDVEVQDGRVPVRLEYFEWVHEAQVQLEWERLAEPTPTKTPTPAPTHTPTPTNTPTHTPTPTATTTPNLEETTIPFGKATPLPSPPPPDSLSAEPRPETELAPIAAESAVPFTTLLRSNRAFRSVQNPAIAAFTSADTWNEFSQLQAERSGRRLPRADWETRLVLGVFYGTVPAQNASLAVRDVRLTDQGIDVIVEIGGVRFRSRSHTSYPAHVIAIPRDALSTPGDSLVVRVLTDVGDVLDSTEIAWP